MFEKNYGGLKENEGRTTARDFNERKIWKSTEMKRNWYHYFACLNFEYVIFEYK